ncbi:MAG: hypothetical protein KA788_01565 [Lacunisphaera sp.]|jgi:hypothetical protein|nr:hypothetical protein [Lacunisphaera sp.]
MRIPRVLACLLCLGSVLAAASDRSLLLIPINGSRPDYLAEADQPFKATGETSYRRFWYAEDLKAPALWDAAAGYEVGSASWSITVVAAGIMADHRFPGLIQAITLACAFVRVGLIPLKSNHGNLELVGVKGCVAFPWMSSGSAAVVLKNPRVAGRCRRTREVLVAFARDPASAHGPHFPSAELPALPVESPTGK